MDRAGIEPSALTPDLADRLARTEARGPNNKIRFHHFARRFAQHLIDIGVAQPVPVLGCAAPAFFITEKGTRLTDCGARYNFAQVCQRNGLRAPQQYCRHGRGPRIHDLRHTFAVRTMVGWYRAGKDPAREMIRLTTYLGHTDPANTFWYLEAVPELLDLAMARATSGGEADQ